MILNINFCEEPGVLYVFMILRILIFIIKIFVPLILIYSGIKPLAIMVVTGKDFKEYIPNFVRKIVAGLIVFLIPTIVAYAMDTLTSIADVNNSFQACFTNANKEGIQRMKDKQEKEAKEALEKRKSNIEAANQHAEEEIRKNKENYKKKEQEKNDSVSSNNNDEQAGSNNAYGSLFIGDSRTVGLAQQLGLGATDKVFATSGGAMNEFNSDISKAINIIEANPSKRYNLVLNYGVNNTSQDWVSAYKNVIERVNGKANILVVSVNPCNESIARYCRNSNIEALNNKLRNNFANGYSNVKYCDTYTPFVRTPNYVKMIETTEGIHYTNEGSKFIYSKINQCLNNF